MRTAFIETLTALAAEDHRVALVTADLGWSVVERFARAYPDRFLNVGVAEQNMVGVATGLARAGLVPFLYSIATFSSMRCYEQFRTGPVLHRLPVRLVGIGGGFAYGHAGPTHYAVEDLAILRAQPGVTVIAPADSAQTRSVVRATADHPGPVYLRIDKAEAPDLPGLDGRFALGRPELIRTGSDLLLLSTGSMGHTALAAADRLAASGIDAAVAVMAHIAFEPPPELAALLAGFPAAVTVEEGSTAGGLGSLAAETVARDGPRCRVLRLGVGAQLPHATGSTGYMRRLFGLDPDEIARAAAGLVTRRAAAWVPSLLSR
jgi:transketolase